MSNQVLNTYQRKRMPYKIIKDVETLCRLCLKCDEVTIPIFNEHDEGSLFYNLPKRILICTGIEVRQDAKLPQNICTNCNKEIERIVAYKKSCEASELKLSHHLLALAVEEEKNMALSNLQAMAAQQQTEVIQLPVSSSVCKDIVTVVGQEPECEVLNREEGEREEDVSALITSKLIESNILLMDNGGFTLSEDSVHLSNVDFEILTADNQLVSYELFEESEQEDEDDNSTNLVMQLPGDTILKTPTKDIEIKKPNCRKEHQCTKCGKKFASRGSLQRHKRVHTGVRPYVCGVCDRSFAQNEVLRRHELVHKEERPFKCSECEKSFTQLNALSVHQRSHAPPQARALKLHPCKLCHKVFLYSSGVTRHVMVHHNGLLYGCTVAGCQQKFTDRSSMRRHIGLKHAPS